MVNLNNVFKCILVLIFIANINTFTKATTKTTTKATTKTTTKMTTMTTTKATTKATTTIAVAIIKASSDSTTTKTTIKMSVATTNTTAVSTTTKTTTTTTLNPTSAFMKFLLNMAVYKNGKLVTVLTNLENYIQLNIADSKTLYKSDFSLLYVLLIDSNVVVNLNQTTISFNSGDGNQSLYCFDRANQYVYFFDQSYNLLAYKSVLGLNIVFMYLKSYIMYAMTVTKNTTCIYEYSFNNGLVGNSIIGNLSNVCDYFYFDQ